jgi:transketolase
MKRENPSIAKFRSEFPNRFINTGVAEQIMIGMVAGMAQRGLRPFAYTIATFTLYRPLEIVRDDLCYQDLPVTIVGIGGGVTYSTLDATHYAQEDIALGCALPNMNVIAPCDPAEVEAATRWCAKQELGPVYLRLAKAGEPNLTGEATTLWQFGKIRKYGAAPTSAPSLMARS